MDIDQKYDKLKEILTHLGKTLIAYSGGVDSTFLLKVAIETLGKSNVAACIARGPSLPASQYQHAVSLAKNMGVEVITIKTDEMDDPAYVANKADRCHRCKSHLFEMLNKLAKDRGYNSVACGHNLDDTKDYRPGNLATKEFGVRTPLIGANLTKQDIRTLSKKLNLPTADMPASPCLASRIAYGLEITDEKLKQVEDAEDFFRSLGLVEFRVRHHGAIARIELQPEDMGRVLQPGVHERIVEKLRALGFQFVTLDLAGFRSGSLNQLLSEEDKKPYSG